MTDSEIRRSFHGKMLRRYHGAPDTLVVDELGLRHGSGRADVAVVNGRLLGYEIKSDRDSLARLKKQIPSYDAVFDSITIVVGARHRSTISRRVPRHWGIMLAMTNEGGRMSFKFKRLPKANPRVDLLSVVQLLWKAEALEIVREINSSREIVRFQRSQLYRYLVKNVPAEKLRRQVRERLRNRSNWRGRTPPFQYGDSCLPKSISSGRLSRGVASSTERSGLPRRNCSQEINQP